MAHCVILVFNQPNDDLSSKVEILKQLGYTPIQIIDADERKYTQSRYVSLDLYGFLSIANQLITKDSLQWCFPCVESAKIVRLFARLVSDEYRRAVEDGLSTSLAVCHT